ncbi:contractile injection system tape measure protein [Terracoccus sp. 273MFTsu3.1]|uniref:contractile injection system tape measure protein n=1 Tax=Terracoccus sp. 273MFTsu3.1 TaxID=1172188 RepID=UPI0003A77FA6|nr:contractile injection system tape measure protein [Terracoccus sp. 273MFTsu3.1]
MTDVAVDVLRLRGPGAQRLARVAATTLPAALDRALADVGDIRLEHVSVTLDLSVDDYDDETLAVLWAEAIRAQVLAGGVGRRDAVAPGGDADASLRSHSRPSPVDVAVAARLWTATAGPRPADLPSAVLALADPQMAASARARLACAEWDAVVDTIEGALAPQTGSGAAASTDAPSSRSWADPPQPPVAPAPDDASTRDATPEDVAPTTTPRPVREAEMLARLAAVAQVAPESGAPVVLADLTRAAGLVLLYPWLADHCRRAEALHPRLDPVDVREVALAAVVDPDDPTLADDPLVQLLAGRPPAADVGPRARMPLNGAREIAESADGVLTGFAGLLPGFERSSQAFVRASWVVRAGLLDTDRDPVLLTAATHPLDVLLPRLPYPVGLLKLPWSPPVTVRFR